MNAKGAVILPDITGSEDLRAEMIGGMAGESREVLYLFAEVDGREEAVLMQDLLPNTEYLYEYYARFTSRGNAKDVFAPELVLVEDGPSGEGMPV